LLFADEGGAVRWMIMSTNNGKKVAKWVQRHENTPQENGRFETRHEVVAKLPLKKTRSFTRKFWNQREWIKKE